MPDTKLVKGQKISPPILSGGPHAITALLNYSSGRPHGAIDIACPIGTKLYAPFDGVVTACVDGVPNNRPGESIYSGKPSNWILLRVSLETTAGKMQDATIFLQHLSPGLKVKVGDRVKKGQLLGETGNSGNSTGPHLHCGAQWVRAGRGSGSGTRYDHVNDGSLRVWGPERYIFNDGEDEMALSDEDVKRIAVAVRKEVWGSQDSKTGVSLRTMVRRMYWAIVGKPAE